jgi:hypothetical protein
MAVDQIFLSRAVRSQRESTPFPTHIRNLQKSTAARTAGNADFPEKSSGERAAPTT